MAVKRKNRLAQKITHFYCRTCGEYHLKTHAHYRAMKKGTQRRKSWGWVNQINRPMNEPNGGQNADSAEQDVGLLSTTEPNTDSHQETTNQQQSNPGFWRWGWGELNRNRRWFFALNSNHVIALATLVAAGSAVIYTDYASRQWETMSQQLDATRSTIYQARTALRQSAVESAAEKKAADTADARVMHAILHSGA